MANINLGVIRKKRKDKRIPLIEMASILGFKNASNYLKYETGDYKFNAEHLPLIAERLDLTMDDIFFDPELAEIAN